MTDQGQGDVPAGGGGFAPLSPIGGPSLEEEERAMKSGRGRMLAGMIGAVVVVLGGLVWAIGSQQPSEYGAIGRQINGLRRDHFDAFWGCALPRADLREINGAERLIAEISERAATPRAYATYVRDRCLGMLDEHLPPLDALIVPEDMRADFDTLRQQVTALRQSWGRFLDHLERLEGGFDAEDETVREMLTAIARAWYEYKSAHRRLNDTIRQHLAD